MLTTICARVPFLPRHLLLLLLTMLLLQFEFHAISPPTLLVRVVGGGVDSLNVELAAACHTCASALQPDRCATLVKCHI